MSPSLPCNEPISGVRATAECRERQYRDEKLEGAASETQLPVSREDLQPVAGRVFGKGHSCEGGLMEFDPPFSMAKDHG